MVADPVSTAAEKLLPTSVSMLATVGPAVTMRGAEVGPAARREDSGSCSDEREPEPAVEVVDDGRGSREVDCGRRDWLGPTRRVPAVPVVVVVVVDISPGAPSMIGLGTTLLPAELGVPGAPNERGVETGAAELWRRNVS